MRALAWTYRWNEPLEAAKWFHAAGATSQESDALFDASRTEEVNEKTMEFLEAPSVAAS